PACVEPVHPARPGLPTLLRGRRRDLRRRPAAAAIPRGLSTAWHARGCRRGLDRLWARDRTDSVAAVPLAAAADRPRERACRAGDARAARPGIRVGPGRAGLAARGRRDRVAERMVRCLSGHLCACRRGPPGRPGQLHPRPRCRARRNGPVRRLCLAPVAELRSAYLITGTDRPKLTRALRRLRDRVGQEATEHLNANEASGEDAAAACNALGLFTVERRLVVVEDVE